MPASFLSKITDDMIRQQFDRVKGAGVSWSGHMPKDAADYDSRANDNLNGLALLDIRLCLERHDIDGDDPADEVRMAISIACEPDDMPDGGIVELFM